MKSSASEYNASTPCVLDSQYAEMTRTSGSSRNVSYRISYRFVNGGEQYSGTDTTFRPPTARWATVYYMAGNPQDNSLGPNPVNNYALIAAGAMLLIGIIARIGDFPRSRHSRAQGSLAGGVVRRAVLYWYRLLRPSGHRVHPVAPGAVISARCAANKLPRAHPRDNRSGFLDSVGLLGPMALHRGLLKQLLLWNREPVYVVCPRCCLFLCELPSP